MKQTRQAVLAIKQSIFLDVYGKEPFSIQTLDEARIPKKNICKYIKIVIQRWKLVKNFEM